MNHIPAKSASPMRHGEGSAIWMDKADHMRTASWGRSGGAWQRTQAQLIERGRYREAVQMDIDDIRSKFGNKYDRAIADMLEYLDSGEFQKALDTAARIPR